MKGLKMDRYQVCIILERIHTSADGWNEYNIVSRTGLSPEFTSEEEAKEAYLKLSYEIGRTCKIYSSTPPSLQNNFMYFLEIESLVRNLVAKKKADLTISVSVEGKNRTVCVYGRDLFCGKRIEISGSVGYVLNELKKKYKRK